ncbi:cytochrome P450 [Mycena galericulata]|nr:cytochrome P450 [Mycena galericulata]
MAFTFDTVWTLPLGLVAVLILRRFLQYDPAKCLPPGPPGLPVIGNLHQLSSRSWLTFTKWREIYGPLFYLNVAGQNFVVLGSHQVAADLLDRRAPLYSDRPRNIVAGLLTGNLVFALSQHNDLWKRMRRGSHEALNNQMSKNYHPFQENEAVLVVHQFLETPHDFDNHLRRAATSLVMSVIYGTPPLMDSKDPDILRVNRFTERALAAAAPGAYLVEYFTWMEKLPRWMCSWRRYAEDWFIRDSIMFEQLFQGVEQRMKGGDETSSVAATLIHDRDKLGLSDTEAAWLSATLYAAGAETTSGQMAWFMLALILSPECQKRAQEEIDRVVGRDRLPTFKDYDNLPYIRAFVKETLRWRGADPLGNFVANPLLQPLTTLGVPHRLCQDDWYEVSGRRYFIPKDTICVANVWALNHDPAVYGPDAEDFNPGRHLDEFGQLAPAVPETKDENHLSYGFGRRICVGRHVANQSMFIQIACLLWCFDIGPAKDEQGNIVMPDPMNSVDEGLIVRPAPFSCTVVARSPEVASVIAHTKELRGI